MTELNKNSFFLYFLRKTGGRHDPALLTKMIEILEEWLPDEVGFSEFDYSMDAYDFGQKEYKQFLMDNLK